MQIELKKTNGKALYIQLYNAIVEEIHGGKLKSGSKLPSRRELSKTLNIAQSTVDNAYKMLQDTGYIVSIPRQGCVVSFKTNDYNSDIPWEIPAAEQYVFSANGIDISQISRTTYAKIAKDIVYNDGKDIFSYVEKGGEFTLRSSISRYLYSFKNIKCTPWQIIIGAGAEYLLCALSILFDTNTNFIMENPCDPHYFKTLLSYKNNVITLPINSGEFDVEALYRCKGDVLFIEPSGRFPRGTALSKKTKVEILNWANQSENRYIIENGCETEIEWNSFDSLYNMDKNEKVVYLGSFARSLSPAIKTSYMVLPNSLLSLWKDKHAYYYSLTPKPEQYILSEFINKGYFTKHYKKMRKIYKEKREYLAECLKSEFGEEIEIFDDCGSTYITAKFRSYDTENLQRQARKVGVKLFTMNTYVANPAEEKIKDDKFVIGIGDLSREKISKGVAAWKYAARRSDL